MRAHALSGKRSRVFAPVPVLNYPMSVSQNTLTNLIPRLYEGLDVVSRELSGFIPSVTRNTSAERAAVGQSVTYHVAPAMGSFDVTPAMAVPETTDRTMGNGSLVITKSKGVNFGFAGEEVRGLNTGPGFISVQADMFAQAIRTLVNEVEADLAVEAALGASRAYGAANAVLVASGLGDLAQIRKMLDDNGAPMTGRSFVMDTTNGASVRSNSNLSKANEAGTSMTLRQGELLDVFNLSLKESAQVRRHTPGTSTNAVVGAAAYAIGATAITLAASGSGTIVAGDVITIQNDPNKYVVVSGGTVGSAITITIAAPGLRQAIGVSTGPTITITGAHAQNVAFAQSAMHLVARAPALPNERDIALDRFMITDPRSGLPLEISVYPGYRKVRYEAALAWGVKAVKTEHIVLGISL